MPVEVSGRTFAFGRPEGSEEAIVPRDIEGKRAGNDDGNQDRDGDMDDTTSGSDTDSI